MSGANISIISRINRYIKPYQLPLTRREIRRALRLGLGRVHLHKHAYGLDEYSEDLYQACLKNLVYDVQCEPSRAPWLYELLNPEQKQELARRLLERMPRTRKQKNLRQQCEICLHLAKDGICEAKDALYASVRISPYGSMMGAKEIIELDGSTGLVWLCRELLEAAESEETESCLSSLTFYYNDLHGKDEAENIIAKTTGLELLVPQVEPDYDCGLETPRIQQHSKKTVRKLDVSDVITLIDSVENLYYIRAVSLWANQATKEQLKELAKILAQETSEHRIRHILTVFRYRDLPLFEKHGSAIIRLTRHPDGIIRRWANFSLARVNHPSVREHSLKALRTGCWLQGEILGLSSNLETGDHALLEEQVTVSSDDYKHHRLINDLVEICEANPWPELKNVTLFVYQTSPCTSCRHGIRKIMLEAKVCPAWIEAEWPFDVDSLDED